jgi:CubicO group peptidase (beta-lactamase class C family)
VTVEHLLTHTAGLPAHREHWRLGLPPAELKRHFLEEPLEGRPGERVVYSDIGFMLLGWLAEAVAGRSLDALVSEWVTRPLELSSTRFGPCPAGAVAATEMGPDGRYITGVVHDENAAALGAPAGHAGLFSTAADLGAYLGAWVSDKSEWLPRRWRDEAVKDRTTGRDGHRGLGWVARGDSFDLLGDRWPATAVSHSGFTGTSLAFDPQSGRWVVLLTNDVHFGRGRNVIKPLRQAVHQALAP